MTRSDADRVLTRSVLDPATGCRVWQGTLTRRSRGYGRISVNGRTCMAHHVTYAVFCGPVPDGLEVMHTCDNSRCVEPSHLKLGTHTDNMRDCVAKGRNNPPRGGRAAGAKLTDADVVEILQMLADGYSQYYVADAFGVSQGTIGFIARGETWRHIPRPPA
jgi:DNA-binding CsgD family transcriptional regulator